MAVDSKCKSAYKFLTKRSFILSTTDMATEGGKKLCYFRHCGCGTYGGRGSVHKVLVGKPEGKIPLGRPRRRWEYNIKMDLQGVRRDCGDLMELAQDRDR